MVWDVDHTRIPDSMRNSLLKQSLPLMKFSSTCHDQVFPMPKKKPKSGNKRPHVRVLSRFPAIKCSRAKPITEKNRKRVQNLELNPVSYVLHPSKRPRFLWTFLNSTITSNQSFSAKDEARFSNAWSLFPSIHKMWRDCWKPRSLFLDQT